MQAFLEDRPTLHRMFNGGIAAYTPDGTVIADSLLSTDRVGKNYTDIDTVAAAVREGKSTVGQSIIGKKLQAPIISMGVPIRDPEGEVIGGMGSIVNLELPNLLGMMLENRYGKSCGYILIAPQYRLIVTATDKSRIMQTLPAPGMNPLFDKYMQGFKGCGAPRAFGGTEPANGFSAFSGFGISIFACTYPVFYDSLKKSQQEVG